MADDELAALAGRALQLRGHTIEEAILLDDDIADAPIKPRSGRASVASIQRGHLPENEVLEALRRRGIQRKRASPDGNCAQRAANASADSSRLPAATASDPSTMTALRMQRERIVDHLLGDGVAMASESSHPAVTMHDLREYLNVASGLLRPFRASGHWNASKDAFIAFLWGIADDLHLPLAVLHRSPRGYQDPICVYRPKALRREASRRDNLGLFAYFTFAELLQILDSASDSSPPLALVDFVPGHYSPFVYSNRGAQADPPAGREGSQPR
jgi:hypothetical protein